MPKKYFWHMYNLKRCKGSFKGLIGECLFKLTDRSVIVTRFFNKQKYLQIFNGYIHPEQLAFIEKYWFSIDAIRVDLKSKKACLYEVKTRNKRESFKPHWKTTMTQATSDIYTKALFLGFEVKIATVWLFDNWNYAVEFEDFERAEYHIDKPKPYDRQGAL